MGKKWLLGIPLFVLLAMLVWLAVVRVQRQGLHDDLLRAVQMYRIGYASRIEIRAVTDFEWDLLHIFGPNSSRESVNQALGFEWIGTRFLYPRLENDESLSLLVFVRSERVVRSLAVQRSLADFSTLSDESPFTPQEAQFFILPGSDNRLGRLAVPGG